MTTPTYTSGTLVRARGREWVVQPESSSDFLVLRPMAGTAAEDTALFPDLETVAPASFPLPSTADLGDHASARLLRDALRIGFRSSAGPFRSLAGLAVEPRAYQLVPLLMALRMDPVRLLIADDVGIGKTVEAGLIAAELLATGQASGLSVLCSPALAEQWQAELRDKFGLDAALVLPSTAKSLQRGLSMDESLFERYPVTVVSTDFIKSPVRRDEFVRAAPDLLIVDEAHTSVSGGGQGGQTRTQRHELLRRLTDDPNRHVLLVTATPHSGQEEGFRNLLDLLRPSLGAIDLDHADGRSLLAQHFVQRRRGDIRYYLTGPYAQETPFPSDRLSQERPYTLSPAYRDLFDDVLNYARASVVDADTGAVQQRVRWWSALALLRSLASSPAAAAATLKTRAANAEAVTAEEADALGRSAVMDHADDETLEGVDVIPGAVVDEDDAAAAGQQPKTSEQRRLRDFARRAEALEGPTQDRKLAEVTTVVEGLLADGFDPIVFCRFIPTAEYVGAHLAKALGKTAEVGVVTGTLPPAERIARIAELTEGEGRRVLVATDCLSEGVNLQEHFQAVVHYDLAWNPTRHEQREGRVDRFGQRSDTVRAVTLYGTDNQIDGLVLEILLRKHEAIRRATGVSVPVPDSSTKVMEAVVEGLLLRGRDYDSGQLELGGIADSARQQLEQSWNSAADAEKLSQTKYAQRTIKPEEVAQEVAQIRDALGSSDEIAEFVRATLTALGSTVVPDGDGLTASTGALPRALRDAMVPGHRDPLPFHGEPPAPRHEAVLARTDPNVEAIARYTLDAALDPAALPADLAGRLAKRAGVFRSDRVAKRTTVLLVRLRLHLDLPGRDGPTRHVVEHADTLAFTGRPPDPQWLDPEDVRALIEAPASSIGAGQPANDQLQRALDEITALDPQLNEYATRTAEEVTESHRRVRRASRDALRGLHAEPVLPVDVLGVWVYLPEVAR